LYKRVYFISCSLLLSSPFKTYLCRGQVILLGQKIFYPITSFTDFTRRIKLGYLQKLSRTRIFHPALDFFLETVLINTGRSEMKHKIEDEDAPIIFEKKNTKNEQGKWKNEVKKKRIRMLSALIWDVWIKFDERSQSIDKIWHWTLDRSLRQQHFVVNLWSINTTIFFYINLLLSKLNGPFCKSRNSFGRVIE
jgi:hypothetical protein